MKSLIFLKNFFKSYLIAIIGQLQGELHIGIGGATKLFNQSLSEPLFLGVNLALFVAAKWQNVHVNRIGQVRREFELLLNDLHAIIVNFPIQFFRLKITQKLEQAWFLFFLYFSLFWVILRDLKENKGKREKSIMCKQNTNYRLTLKGSRVLSASQLPSALYLRRANSL